MSEGPECQMQSPTFVCHHLNPGMRMTRAILVTVMAIGCLVKPAFGTQVFGSSECGKWLGAKTEPLSRNGHELWLVGYLSGLSVMHDRAGLQPADPLSRLGSMNQVFVWMDNYCQLNPLKWVVQGADQLWTELSAVK
jgi:hypothetical protein